MGKLFDKTVLKFILVGVLNTALGAGIMFLLYNLAGWSYWPSTAANYVVGGIVSFFLNKAFTFQNKEKSVGQVLRFVLTMVLCWIVAYAVAKPLVLLALATQSLKVQENISMLVGMCLYTGLNYFGQRFFVFSSK